MASPFEIFRKNQRILMAAAVLIAITSFIITPMIERFITRSSGRGGPNPVLVSWQGGYLRQQELQLDQADVQLANRFLADLARKVITAGGFPEVPGVQADLSVLGITNSVDENILINRRLWLTEAKRLGIQFDDNSVKLFLQKFANRKVAGDQILKTLFSATDRQMTMPHFTRFMKDELTVQAMLRLLNSGMMFDDVRDSRRLSSSVLSSPSKNWREYLRLKQKAKIAAYGVNVRDFLDKIENKPTEKELRDLYEAGKDTIRNSNMLDSEPAFKSPALADIEYLFADIAKFESQEAAKISEETLRAEYERRVAEKGFRVPIEEPKKDEVSPLLPPADSPEQPATNNKPTTTETPNTPSSPETTVPPSTGESNPAAPAASDPSLNPAAPSDNPRPPALEDPKSVQQTSSSNVKLVSMTQEQTSGGGDSTPPTGESQSSTTNNETPVTQAADVEKTPETGTLQLGEQSTPTAQSTENVAESVPMRTKTFEEVKDQIASEMALGPATNLINEKMNDVYSRMSTFKAEYEAFKRATEEKVKGISEPVKLNLEEIGRELGLEYGKTGMIDSEGIQLLPIGQSSVSRGQRNASIPVPRFVAETRGLGEAFTPLASFTSTQSKANRFVFWKTDVKEAVIPSFETVRDTVEAVWKVQQAQKLAEKKASELASKVGSGQIEDVLLTDEEKKGVAYPTPFSALSDLYPFLAQFNPEMAAQDVGRIELLLPVDKSFMDSLFSKSPGECVTLPDAKRTVYYVVKLLETTPSTAELLDGFKKAPSEAVPLLGYEETERAILPLFRDLQKRLGVRYNSN